jgi:hypothetical protein
VLPHHAAAEAWVPAPGQRQVIITMAPVSAAGGAALETYAEVGLADGIAWVVSPSAGRRADRSGDLGMATEAMERTTAVRLRLPARSGWAASVQIGLVEASRLPGPGIEEAEQEGPGIYRTIEPRLALGHGNSGGWWGEGAVGLRRCPGASGWHSVPRWTGAVGRNLPDGSLVMMKGFGSGTACGDAGLSVQASIVRPLPGGAMLEFGWRHTTAAVALYRAEGTSLPVLLEAPDASGPVLGLWRRY